MRDGVSLHAEIVEAVNGADRGLEGDRQGWFGAIGEVGDAVHVVAVEADFERLSDVAGGACEGDRGSRAPDGGDVEVVLVGTLILSGAVNTAIIGSNGVLNRVAEQE